MDDAYKKCAKAASYLELYQGLQPFVYWNVTESVQEGYGPEAIGEIQEEAEVEALVLERRSIARDHALGFFISLLCHYLARQSGPSHTDAAIETVLADLDKEPPVASFTDFHLDTADIYEYINEQRQNDGLIADDPDWHQRTKVSGTNQWTAEFKKALELTRMAYVEACQRFEHRFALGSQADLALVRLLTNDELARIASQSKAQPRHAPAPPTSTTGNAVTTAGYWGKRIGQSRDIAPKFLPEFDPAHLVQAGQQFRAACLDHVRTQHASDPSKDINAALSQALNPETNPERLVERARQLWTPQSATPSPQAAAANDEAALVKTAKDLVSSALRILGTRDGERNVSLRIDAHNLRGHINQRLAALKPQHRVNYLNRAAADGSASIELDMDQSNIAELLAQTEAQLESLSTSIDAGSDGQEEKTPSADTSLSKQASKSGSSKGSASQPSTSAQLSAASGAKNSCSDVKQQEANSTSADGEGTTKPRDKTILESPFFRSDLVTGLMVDSLLNLAFPHRALRETLRFPSAASLSAASQDYVTMLERLAKTHQQTNKSLTAENKAQLKTAVKTVSAVLALPDLQNATRDDAEVTLRRTSLRLVLGTLFLLENDLVKAQTELELVSNALKPNPRGVGRASNTALGQEGEQSAVVVDDKVGRKEKEMATWGMQMRVQGQTLLLLAKACWLGNKVQESIKFFRWFVRWYSEQQARRVADCSQGEGVELEEVDMGWWDRVVVVTKA